MSLSKLNGPVCSFLAALAVIGIPKLTAQQVQFSTAHRNSEHVLSQRVAAAGSEALTTKLAGRTGISVAMADFDSDGTPDLVTGYATSGGGVLLLQRGSSLAAGQSGEPFVARAEAIDLPVRPDFLKSADITGRGHADLLVAANADTTVYLLKGLGDGTFAAPEAIALRGAITSLTTWRGPSGDNLIVAGVCSSDSCGLQFLANDGMTKSFVSTSGPATNLETANLNHGHLLDIAAVVSGAVLLVTGDTVTSRVPRTEALPSDDAAALTTGSFVYDRRGFAQVAVLGSNAMLHIFARSGVDNTVPTMDEVRANRALDHARGVRPTPLRPSGVSWTEVETLPGVGSGGVSPLMIRGRVTAGGSDDLLVFNSGQLVQVSHVAVRNGNTQQSLPLITNDSTASPVTSALAATLTPDVRQSLVTAEGGFHPYVVVPPPANRVMNVNSTADGVPNATTINACKNGTAGCTLRSAISVANSDAGITANSVDTINLPAGTFILSANNGSAADVNGDTNIHLDLDGSVNIVGAGSELTTIDANHLDNIFDINSGVEVAAVAPRSFFISGVTPMNGLNSNNPNINKRSFNYIGGIISWEANGGGHLTMNDVVLTDGKAMWGAGGAVGASNVTPDTTGGVLELDNSTVSNNSTAEAGGGLSLGHNNLLVLNTVAISGNSALTSVNWSDPSKSGEGGGVDSYGNTVGARDTITNSTISGNSATVEGGGLDLLNGFTMSGTRVMDNTGGQYGGGLVFKSLNTAATVTTSAFTGNSATKDGADICVRPESGSNGSNPLTMRFSRVHGNTGTPHNGIASGCQATADTASDTVTSNFPLVAPPTNATGTVSSAKAGARSTASAMLNVVTHPAVDSPVVNTTGTGSIFLAIVEQLGTSSGRIDLYNVTLGATDAFTGASPASLAVTNSTNEGKPDVDNPRDLVFDSQGDLLIANGGQGGAVVAGSPDYGSFACVPAGAIVTGSSSTTTNSSNARDPESIAIGTDSSVAIGNVPASSSYNLVQYLLGSIYTPAPVSRDVLNPGGANAVGTTSVVALPTLTAGTFAAAITNGTNISRITVKAPNGTETAITDPEISSPQGLGWDAGNTQLAVVTHNITTTGGINHNTSKLGFYNVSPTNKVKSVQLGVDGLYPTDSYMFGDKVAVSPDGHVAVAGGTADGPAEVRVYDNSAARNPVGGPIPFDTYTNNGCTVGNFGSVTVVYEMRWLSNTKLLIALRANTAGKQGVYIYDISTLVPVPAGLYRFDGNAGNCNTVTGTIPKQTGFQATTNPPLALAVRSTVPVYVDGNGTNCSGNVPCYISINTAISSTPAGSIINILGGTFNESVNLNNNVIVNLDANTTVDDFTFSTGTFNLAGGNCGQGNGATLTLKAGDWVNSGGTFNAGSGTVAFTGTSTQHISGNPTTFSNVTNNNTAGLTLSSNTTVTGVLGLTSSDITTGTNTLTQPSTSGASTGTFDVVGNYQRTGSPLPNTALTYGNPNNVITLSGGAVTSLTVQLTKDSAPASLPKAVQRSYVITPTGSFTSATVQLHYLSGELNGNTEGAIVLTRFDSGQNRWLSQGAASRDTTNKWVQATGVTQFSTFSFISPPSISSINPNQGKTAGGNNVTITGSYLTGAGGVTIGGNALTNVSVVSDTQITGTTPAGTIGAASVIVNAAGGSNAANSLFTYIGPPTSTNGGPVNTVVNTAVNVTLTATDPNNPVESLTYSYSQPAHGTVTGSGPMVTYTPAAGYQGSDSFTFSAMNSFGLTSDTATESLFVADVAQNQSVSVPFNTAKAITLTGLGTGTETYIVVTNPTHGALSGTAPNLTYTPTTGYSGTDSFTFKINNGVDSNTATVSITVLPAPPVANNQSVTVAFNTAKAITLTASGTGTLTYSVVSSPTNGTLSGTAPNLTYTPNAGYFGSDSFTFKANNGTDGNTATVSITVLPAAPVANNQSVSVPFNTGTAITLTASGSGTLTYSVVASPAHGTLSGTAPNLTYTPTPGYSGSDSFTFKANNGTDSNTATVSITVLPAAPVANNQSVSVPFNTATAITLTASGSGTLTYSVVASPAHGTLSGTAPNLTYTPTTGYSGSDSFTFKANNGTDSNTATVSITVLPAAPVANNQSVSVPFNTATAITLTASGSGTLTYSVVASPAHGTLSGTAPNLTYTPTTGYSGPDSFTFKANNGTDSNTATVSITVLTVTHYSVSAPLSATAGTAFNFTVTALDQFNNTATGYTGTVHFTSSDAQAVLPANSTLTNGTGTFPATLKTAGNQTITGTDTVTSSITGTSGTISVSAPDLQISKTHSPSSFIVNDQGDTFTITVTNTGNAASSGTVTVTDTLPSGLTFAGSTTAAGWSCNAAGSNPVVCSTTNAIAATNGTSQVTISVNVASSTSSPLTNNVSVACTCPESNTGNNSNTDSVTVLQTVGITLATSPTGLQVSGDGGATFFAAPHTFQWVPNSTHTIVTTSPQSGGVGTQYVWLNWSDAGAISHTINAGTTTATYTANFKTQYQLTTQVSPSATFGSISPSSGFVDANSMVSVTASPNVGYAFTGFTGALTGTTNPQTLTVTAPSTVTANFAALPDVAIGKTHPGGAGGHFSQGQLGATYTLSVSNNGPGVTSGTVTVTESIPTGLTLVSMAGTGWTCGAPNANNVCTRTDSLGSGGSYQSITVTVNVDPAAPSSVTNSATVSATGDYNSSNNTALDPTTVNKITDVSAQVSVTQSGFGRNRATGIWSATLTVTNNGGTINGPVQVVLTNLSSNATMTNATGTRNGSPYITVSAGALAPGASASVTISFTNPTNGFITYTAVTDSGVF